MENNASFLKTAKALKPKLHKRIVRSGLSDMSMTQGDQIVLDFSEHLVGFVTLSFETVGSHPDAPAWLDLQLAEREQELSERVEDYHGWVSASWVQQERIHLDTFPCTVRLPRRYAFRYLKISVLGISSKFRLVVSGASCEAVSSADDTRLLPYRSKDDKLLQLDRIACRTLHDCMQDVFEDGPKRDRRLWLGDLRLQALANAETYRQFDLVKRCLYLFAGSTLADGRISAAIFTEPEIEADDTVMFD